MVEQGRSPASENRQPIQKWEVTAIPDAVEAWYAQGADSNHAAQASVEPSVAPSRPTTTQSSTRNEQGGQSAITQPDMPQLVEEAVQIMCGGVSSKAQEERVEDTIRVLRIEEKVLSFVVENNPDKAVNEADKLRTDPLGFGLINAAIQLHPDDANRHITRRYAFWFHEQLVNRVCDAQQEGARLTRQDLLDMYARFKRREGEFENLRGKAEMIAAQGHGSIDFSLQNLRAVSERQVLADHLLQHENERVDEMHPATVAVHEMIEGCIGQNAATRHG